jgi:hypothetical protein
MKLEKFIKTIRHETEPTREFTKKTRERFLALFAAEYPMSSKPLWRAYLMRAGAIAAACFVLLGSGAAYADQRNVSAASPLYPLKRVSESLRVALAPESQEAQLHTELAVRRVQELENSARIPAALQEEIAVAANNQLKISLRNLPEQERLEVNAKAGGGVSADVKVMLFSAAPEPGPEPTETAASTTTTTPEGGLESAAPAVPEPEPVEEKHPCAAFEAAAQNTTTKQRVLDAELEMLFDAKCR